ncbi:MAG: SMI1/KNR4 family protein [Polyangiaceae bacterium]|nr:SMI1/KNR4 family protein [Polyangiaceae bacterium]
MVERIIERLAPHVSVRGASETELDALESKLMVELPPTLRRFLEFDYTFKSFGKRWRGRERFGRHPQNPRPRITSLTKLAEATTEFGWLVTRIRARVIRLPNLPGHPWNALLLGEARHDGELPILGLVNEESSVHVFVRYSAFDLYLVEQSGIYELSESQRLDDIESHVALNPVLTALMPDEEPEGAF